MSTQSNGKGRRTHLWFMLYTVAVIAVFGIGLATRQWSVAATALLIAIVFALFTRWLWRRR